MLPGFTWKISSSFRPPKVFRSTDSDREISCFAELRNPKKALDGFFESDSMLGKLVALEIIFEIFRCESAPIDHSPLYYAVLLWRSRNPMSLLCSRW
jgi:hypothetical protein